MKINEAVIRGYNFFVVTVLGILGGAMISELIVEDEWLHRLDEALLVSIGLVAIVWYLVGQNRISRSAVPLILAYAAFGAKILGLALEIKDTADVADDIGVVQFLLLFVIVATIVYIRMRPTLDAGRG
jgi:hypothetical protein